MKNQMVRFLRKEDGQDLIEYSLLCALIAVVCIGAMTTLGLEIGNFFGFVEQALIDAQ